MKRTFKILAWLLFILLAFTVAIGTAVFLFFDPNDYKDEIAALVKKKTGRDLTIAGRIELSLFPWVGVEIHRIALTNAKGFGPDPFLKAEDAGIKVELLPLLKKTIEIDTLMLHGLELHLGVDERGRGNWEDLFPKGAPSTQEKAARPPTAGLAAFTLGGIDVRDGRIVWEDRRSKSRFIIDDLTLQSDRIVPGRPFHLNLAFHPKAPEEGIEGDIAFASRITLYMEGLAIEMKGLDLKASLRGQDLPPLALALKGQAEADLESEKAKLAFRGKLLDAPVEGKIGAEGWSRKLRYRGELRLPPFELRPVLKRLGWDIPAADPDVFKKADIDLSFSGDPDALTIAPLKAKLDDSHLEGKLALEPLSPPGIRFDIALDGIDLDRYLPPEQGALPATPAEGAAASAKALPLETLRQLDIQGKLHIGHLKVSGVKLEGVTMELKAKDGSLRIHPARARLYGGTYEGDTRLDVEGKQLAIALKESLQGIQMGPFLEDFQDMHWLSGRAELSADLRTQGAGDSDFLKHLQGKVTFAFFDGAVKGINIVELIKKAKVLAEGKPAPESDAPNETAFTELKGTLNIQNGVVKNDDLKLKSPLLRITGRGKMDLVQEKVDYRLNTAIVATLEGQGGKELEELKGVVIPIRVEGPLTHPSFKPDIKALVKARAKKKIEEKKETIQKKIEEKLPEPLKEQLKGLDIFQGVF